MSTSPAPLSSGNLLLARIQLVVDLTNSRNRHTGDRPSYCLPCHHTGENFTILDRTGTKPACAPITPSPIPEKTPQIPGTCSTGRANPPPQAARSSTESDLISDSNKKVATSPGKGKKETIFAAPAGARSLYKASAGKSPSLHKSRDPASCFSLIPIPTNNHQQAAAY